MIVKSQVDWYDISEEGLHGPGIMSEWKGTKDEVLSDINRMRRDGESCLELYEEWLADPTYSVEYIIGTWESVDFAERKIKLADKLIQEIG